MLSYERVTRNVTSVDDVVLALRVVGWTIVLPILKRVIAVRTLARAMRLRPSVLDRDHDRERRIVTFARWGARLVRWTSGGNCLERGLIAYRYLCQAGANPSLVIGVGRPEGIFAGHAWVLVDGRPVGERDAALAAYSPVFVFGADGSVLDTSGHPIQSVAR